MRGRGRALVMFMPLTTKEIKLPTLNSIVCIFLWPHSKICHKDGREGEGMITRLKERGRQLWRGKTSAEKSQSLLQEFIGALIFNFASPWRAWDVNNLLKSLCPCPCSGRRSHKKVNMIMMFQMQIHGKSHAHNANVLVNLVCLSIDESVLKWFCWGRNLIGGFHVELTCKYSLEVAKYLREVFREWSKQ